MESPIAQGADNDFRGFLATSSGFFLRFYACIYICRELHMYITSDHLPILSVVNITSYTQHYDYHHARASSASSLIPHILSICRHNLVWLYLCPQSSHIISYTTPEHHSHTPLEHHSHTPLEHRTHTTLEHRTRTHAHNHTCLAT